MSQRMTFPLAVTPATLAALEGWEERRRPLQRRLDIVATDTRRDTLEGALFVALRGNNHDGHAYIHDAVRGGAAAVVVERMPANLPQRVGVYVVADSRRALADLAQLKRRQFAQPVVAITGSAGKTSTKAFVGTLLGPGTYVNPGNWNNDVGVPLSMLAAPLEASAWVLELGMNHSGEIAYLTDIVRPDLGVLLPAGHAHVGNLGSFAAVLEAKAELATALGAPAELVVADRRYVRLVGRERAILVGPSATAAVRVVGARTRFPSGTDITLQERGRRRVVQTPLIGPHWALAVATAWAVGRRLGVRSALLARRARQLATPSGRMQLLPYRGGWILDDSYNASPESYLALLTAIRPWSRRLRLRLLLGEMRELGAQNAFWHQAVAQKLVPLQAETITVVGTSLLRAVRGVAVDASGAKRADVALARSLADWRPGTLLVAKGAHATGIYDALQAFKEARCFTC